MSHLSRTFDAGAKRFWIGREICPLRWVKSGQTGAIKVLIKHMGVHVHVCVSMYVLFRMFYATTVVATGESLQLLCCIIDKKLNLLIFVAP